MQFCYTLGGCGNQLPYRGISDLPSEGHIDPWRFRVASLHLFFFTWPNHAILLHFRRMW